MDQNNSNKMAPGAGAAGQPTEQQQNDYDKSWLLKIVENGFPKGGIMDTPPFMFSHHDQFAEIAKNLVNPGRDGGLTQTLAREIAVVLLAKRFPALAPVAAPIVDTALKTIEAQPAAQQPAAQETKPESPETEKKKKTVKREKPGPVVRKKRRGL